MGDSFEIRPARPQEMDQLGLMGAYSYGGAFGDGPDNVVRNSHRPEWTLCAFDGELMVTSYAAFPFTIRAQNQTLSCAGITAVGTRPEYRRRGLLRKIVTQAFINQRETGQAVAGLWASQAAIYRRYGFAQLGANRTYSIDSVDLNLMQPPTTEVTVTRIAAREGVTQAKGLYREFAQPRFGYLHRGSPMWQGTILAETSDTGPLWMAKASINNKLYAYVIYSLRSDKVDHPARGQEIVIKDLAWLDIVAYKALWQYLAAHDLVGRISWQNAPLDDPLMDLVHEPRMLRSVDREASWFRVVDASLALTNRGYDAQGQVHIQLTPDNLTPWNDGTWLLEYSPEGSTIQKSSATPDLTLSSGALSAAFTGTRRISDLVHSGLAQCDVKQLNQLDRLFATRYAAHCPDHY
ncbi:MAG: GNAT family N-acetyltransferase [Pseudomonadota bacterium]